MKRYLINMLWFLMVFLTLTSCSLNNEENMSDLETPGAKSGIIIGDSKFLVKFNTIIKDNVSFGVCRDKNNSVVYIQTKNKNFFTPENVKVGMQLEDVLIITKGRLVNKEGWSYVLPLASGWNAAFGLSEDGTISRYSTVKWIFRNGDFPKKSF